jgi:hypothetical protein
MRRGACLLMIVSLSMTPASYCRAAFADDDDQETSHQLSLADLTAYRAALSGKPTADRAKATDPPSEVKFKDLWNRADVFRGRRVVVQGRVVRTFRQGAVGTFPPLVEAWITSPAGDPFCVVFPQAGSIDDQGGSGNVKLAPAEKPTAGDHADEIPAAGRMVRFTGTFLKMVRYAGADTARLAPLIVGDQRPALIASEPVESQADNALIRTSRGSGSVIQLAFWALGLAVAAMVAVVLARWHLRAPAGVATRRAKSAYMTPDPPLEFIGPPDEL